MSVTLCLLKFSDTLFFDNLSTIITADLCRQLPTYPLIRSANETKYSQ